MTIILSVCFVFCVALFAISLREVLIRYTGMREDVLRFDFDKAKREECSSSIPEKGETNG